MSIRFHDLRHTYASIQIDLGTNTKFIQSQMGHSSIKLTLDTYRYLMRDVNREAANRLGNAIFNNVNSRHIKTEFGEKTSIVLNIYFLIVIGQ